MANFISPHRGERDLGGTKDNVNVGGAKPFLILPEFMQGPDQPPVFDAEGPFHYTVVDRTGELGEDEILFAVLNEVSSSPFTTQEVVVSPQKSPTFIGPSEETAPAGGGASGNAKQPKLIHQTEGAAMWTDASGRVHVIYSEIMTEKVDGPRLFAKIQVAHDNIQTIHVEVVCDDVNASSTNPIRVLMYNRTEDTDTQLLKFNATQARPVVYLAAKINDTKFKGRMITHALLPSKTSWEREEIVDIGYWTNTECDCTRDLAIEGDPVVTTLESPGPEDFTEEPDVPSPTDSDEIALNQGDGQILGRTDGTKAVSSAETFPAGIQPGTTTDEAKSPPDCEIAEPYRTLSSIGHPSYDRTERHRSCNRILKGMRGFEVNVIDGMPWSTMYLFGEPYTVVEFDDGPLSPIEPELRVSEETDSLHETASTRVFDDDGREADLDDLFTVRQPDYSTAESDPVRLMIRMMCPPDPRGGFIHDPSCDQTGLLRDMITINPSPSGHGHLELKTSVFFADLGTTACDNCGRKITGPLDFRKQSAEVLCIPKGRTTTPGTVDNPPNVPGGVVDGIVAEQGGGIYIGAQTGSSVQSSVYSSAGGVAPTPISVVPVGSVVFDHSTAITARRALENLIFKHSLNLDLSGVDLNMFDQNGDIVSADSLISQIESGLDAAINAGLNSFIG